MHQDYQYNRLVENENCEFPRATSKHSYIWSYCNSTENVAFSILMDYLEMTVSLKIQNNQVLTNPFLLTHVKQGMEAGRYRAIQPLVQPLRLLKCDTKILR